MPFIAPLIGAAFGLGAVGTAVVSAGLAVGLSFAARKLRPKAKTAASPEAQRGVSLSLKIDANAPREWVVGRIATGGSLAYWQLSGTNNGTLHMVIALADHECDGLDLVIVNGRSRNWNSGNGQVDGFGSALVVRFYSGAAGQTADAAVVAASGGRWTNNDRGTGVCYVVVEATYTEEKFPEGIPELAFVIRGAKVYDQRTGSTAYNNLSAVLLYNALRGITVSGEPLLGMNVPTASIRSAEAIAAANACAEDVATKAGPTEFRYRCSAVFNTTMSNREILETVLATMAGDLIEVGGIYRMFAGVAQTPVATITDADIITAEPFVTAPKRSRNDLTNAIHGSFTDPARAYASVPLPSRTSSSDEADDGGIRLSKTFDLSGVTSRTQGQRVLEIERKRARRMATAGLTLRSAFWVLEPGDWVAFNSARRGYVSKVFVVQSGEGNPDLTASVYLAETDAGVDDYNPAIDEINDNQVIDLASAGPPLSAVSGVTLVAITIAVSAASSRPGLQMGWTAITDPTVIELEIEFRKVGDTVAQKTARVSDPSDGTYTWVSGVQSGVDYEARIRPVTRPARGAIWSSWVPAGAATGNQVVPLASTATAVPPDTITPAMLTAQARFEIGLVTQADAVLGSVAQQIAAVRDEAERIAAATLNSLLDANDAKVSIRVEQRERIEADLALAQQVTTISSALNNDVAAAIQQEQLARTTADDALALDITTALTRVNENTAQVAALAQSVNGIEAAYTVTVDINGRVVGYTQLNGSAAGSEFVVAADFFRVAGVTGNGVPVFAVQTVDGAAKMALRGDMLADGTITARALSVSTLSALTASLGTITAGLMRDPASKYYFDVTNGRIGTYDGDMLIDLKNKRLKIGG